MTEIKDETGNCYAACLSMVTGIPFDVLKVDWLFLVLDKTFILKERMKRILGDYGYKVTSTQVKPVGISIAIGDSPRGNWNHAILVKDGEPFFDPHPSNLFIEKVLSYQVVERKEE